MVNQLYAEYIKLNGEVKAAEARLKEKKDKLDELEERVKDSFIEEGIQNINMKGSLIYLRRDIIVTLPKSDSDDEREIKKQMACEALISCGYGFLVKRNFDVRSVSKQLRDDYVRDDTPIDDLKKSIPEELARTIEFFPRFSVVVKKSAAKTAKGKSAAMKRRTK